MRIYDKGRPTEGWMFGELVSKLEDMAVGDILIKICHQFKAQNLIKIVPLPKDHPAPEGIRYCVYVKPDGTPTGEPEMCIHEWEPHDGCNLDGKHFFRAIRISKARQAREHRLLPNGMTPRWMHIYDNGGESADRFTVVFTGRYASRERQCDYIGMGAGPFHPQGVCQHGQADRVIDYPSYGHLGKKISFHELNEDCQIVALRDYLYLWDLVDCPAGDNNVAYFVGQMKIKAKFALAKEVPV
jgi:hypothetical protein